MPRTSTAALPTGPAARPPGNTWLRRQLPRGCSPELEPNELLHPPPPPPSLTLLSSPALQHGSAHDVHAHA
ncbi:uncharacterized protein ACO6RY_18787 [Pungitius sinensis]